jgi:D-erythronate 2-dehydrogenase
MHVAISGASGFVGRALAHRLHQAGHLGGEKIDRLTLLDLAFDENTPSGARVLAGDIGDAEWLKNSLARSPIDVIFHLASVPGGAAEQNYALARRVNLDSTMTLLEFGQHQVADGEVSPVFVFASSIAVFGALSDPVHDDTPTRPALTYGTQKLVAELLVDDFSRRGWVDGRSVRIPGVLCRPPAPTGQLSAFLSDIIRELAAGRPFVCPTSAEATTWASSLPCVVDQLLHAAAFDVTQTDGRRSVTLPTHRFSMRDLVDSIARVFGTEARNLVSYKPDPKIEGLFGRFPTLATPLADKAGFHRDISLDDLVFRSINTSEVLSNQP